MGSAAREKHPGRSGRELFVGGAHENYCAAGLHIKGWRQHRNHSLARLHDQQPVLRISRTPKWSGGWPMANRGSGQVAITFAMWKILSFKAGAATRSTDCDRKPGPGSRSSIGPRRG